MYDYYDNDMEITLNKFEEIENLKEEQSIIKRRYTAITEVIDSFNIDLYKEILIDRYCNDLQYKELSLKYNLPFHTIRNYINRAPYKIIKKLKDDGNLQNL